MVSGGPPGPLLKLGPWPLHMLRALALKVGIDRNVTQRARRYQWVPQRARSAGSVTNIPLPITVSM